jgi:hypothetical protein
VAPDPEPSCHHQQDAPGNKDQQPSHDANAPCSRGQLIEFKTLNTGKILLPIAGILPVGAPPVRAAETFRLFLPEGSRPDVATPIPISILRI